MGRVIQEAGQGHRLSEELLRPYLEDVICGAGEKRWRRKA